MRGIRGWILRWIRPLGLATGISFLSHVFNLPSYVANWEFWHPIVADAWRWLATVMASMSDAWLGILGFSLIFIIVADWTSWWWKPKIAPASSFHGSGATSHDLSTSQSTQGRLRLWRARDGSITLVQAAFLWLDIPMQNSLPPEVQDQVYVFKHAISQGRLKQHKRYDPKTEDTLSGLRLLLGTPVPGSTRVQPEELRRWAESIGYVPGFLSDESLAL